MPNLLREFAARERLQPARAASMFDVTVATWYNWLAGRSVPPIGKAQHIAEAIGRLDVIGLIEADRVVHERELQAARVKDCTRYPTPRTLVIPADHGGAA